MTDKKEAGNKDSAMHVMDGIHSSHDGMSSSSKRRFVKKKKQIPIDELTEKILAGSRLDLARGITLLESISKRDKQTVQQLFHNAVPHVGNSIRIGITGVPGAGKSTFIETFGLKLCNMGYKVAVLAIDPSSSLTGGS